MSEKIEKKKRGRPRSKPGVIDFEKVARHKISVKNYLTRNFLPKLTLTEFKFFMYLLSLEYAADPEHRLAANVERICDIRFVAKNVLNDKMFNVERNLKNFFTNKARLFIQIPTGSNKKNYDSFPIFTLIGYRDEEKIFKYTFSELFLSYVHHDGRNFAESLLANYLSFKKVHSAYFYWYLCSSIFKGAKNYELVFTVKELAQILNVPTKDDNEKYVFKDLKKDVLEGVIDEINETKDITIKLISYSVAQDKVVISCSRGKVLRYRG